MYPGTHLLVSWTGAVNFLQGRRERAVVALTGVAPDLDGLGLIIDEFTGTTVYFIEYHYKKTEEKTNGRQPQKVRETID